MEHRIQEKLGEYPWLVCIHDDTVVGYSYAAPFRERSAYQWSVENSVYVDSEYHRRGVGHGLYEALFAILEQ
jgi:phosphinothricin acetyltransferase